MSDEKKQKMIKFAENLKKTHKLVKMAVTSLGTEIETYGAMVVGFLSVEFLQGWFGLGLTIGSFLIVWSRLVVFWIDRFKKKKEGKK